MSARVYYLTEVVAVRGRVSAADFTAAGVTLHTITGDDWRRELDAARATPNAVRDQIQKKNFGPKTR